MKNKVYQENQGQALKKFFYTCLYVFTGDTSIVFVVSSSCHILFVVLVTPALAATRLIIEYYHNRTNKVAHILVTVN